MPRHKYVTITGAAEDHGVRPKTIRRRIADGTLPAYRVGGQVRIREDDLHLLARPIPSASAQWASWTRWA